MPAGSAAADTGPATSSLQLAAANAQLAAQLAQGPQPALLPRGSGLLVLFSNDRSGKARLLQAGKASVAGQTYRYYSVLQLMSAEGLLLRNGFTFTPCLFVYSGPTTARWFVVLLAYVVSVPLPRALYGGSDAPRFTSGFGRRGGCPPT
jgi:hypothetical protein